VPWLFQWLVCQLGFHHVGWGSSLLSGVGVSRFHPKTQQNDRIPRQDSDAKHTVQKHALPLVPVQLGPLVSQEQDEQICFHLSGVCDHLILEGGDG